MIKTMILKKAKPKSIEEYIEAASGRNQGGQRLL